MARTRVSLLDGALRAVERYGTRRTTMNDIATLAGVAKATLYNHFRTKGEVWSALVESEVGALATECTGRDLVEALTYAAERVSTHAALRRLLAEEPAVLAGLLSDVADAPGWRAARGAVRAQLAEAGVEGDEVVLRWLASHLYAPAGHGQARAGAQALVSGLAAEVAAAT